MNRALDLTLTPAAHPALTLHTYTYDAASVQHDSLAETARFRIDSGAFSAGVELTPDEARVLANQFLQVADQCDAARQRRESFKQISEEMMDIDADGGGPCVFYAHPDIHYVSADQMVAKMAELEAVGVRRYMVMPEDSATGVPA